MSDLSEALQPGDIVNFKMFGISLKTFFPDLVSWFACQAIAAVQKSVFCKILNPNKVEWKDHHSEMYFNPSEVFSVEPPYPTFVTVKDLEQDTGIVTIYRMNPYYFGITLTADDVNVMREAAVRIIKEHQKYDIGQLVDILCDTIAGYPEREHFKWFDQGRKNIVCSVGVAAIIDAWRHTVLSSSGKDIPQPWKVPNKSSFPKDFIDGYPGHWDIDNTMPACFATTDTHFQNEFIRVGQFKNGRKI